jgi:hypothetical protein
LYIGDGFSARAKQISCRGFEPVEQVFVIPTPNPESWHFIHENEPPSVELGLLDAQGVSVTFYHDTVLTFRLCLLLGAVEVRHQFQTYVLNSNDCFKGAAGQKQGVFVNFLSPVVAWSQA